MKKLAIWFASLSLLGLCAAGPALAANYAVCVGINNYKSSYCSNPLNGSVPDARHMTNLITARGEWTAEDVSFLSDSGATRTKIRQTVSNVAAKAKSGDHFLYYHSSHGGNDNYSFTTNSGKVYLHYNLDANGVKNYICSYDADYTAKQMATDLAAFPAGVKIVVMLDTCHSAGMFKYNTTAKSRKALSAKLAEAKATAAEDGSQDGGASAEAPAPENSVAGFFMQAVLDQLRQEEADQVRRGLRPRTAASMATDVGWIAAADYDQYSWDGSEGGAFTEAFINGVTNKNKMCDNATYGNQDGYASFYEGWNYAKDIAKGQRDYSAWEYDSDAGYYDYIWTDAQCTNTTVLNNVLVGWAGKDAPSVAPTFPSATATAGGYVGGEVEYTFSASGSSPITYTLSTSVSSSLYEFDGGYLVFTPSAAGTYTFTCTASNSEGSDTCTLTVTVSAAPVTVPTLLVGDETATTAYATWDECTGVSSYTLQLASDDQFTTGGGSGGEVTLFSNDATDPSAAPDGWTYNLHNTSGSYLQLMSGNYVVTEAFDASACTDLTLSLYMRTYGGTTYPSVTVEYSTDGGTTWSEPLGTLSAANTTMAERTLDVSDAAGASSVRLRIASTSTSSSVGVGIKTIVLTGTEASGSGSLISTATVNGTNYTFTALAPETTYFARVKGDAGWSNVEQFTTEPETVTETAPAWSASFPASGTVNVGELYELAAIASYVTGYPTPVIAFTGPDGVLAEINNGNFQFIPEASGDYTFTFTAANGIIPDATATLVVTAVGQAPVLTASLGTSVAAVVGDTVEFTVTATGIPVPTVAMADTEYDAIFENGAFIFAPDAVGTYAFTFTAENTEGTDTLTVTVTVAPAPVTVPELTVTDITDTTALATWTACDGVTEYTLQLSTNDFAAASGASVRSATPILSEDFSGASGTSAIADFDSVMQTNGWSGEKVFAATNAVRLGTSSASGFLQTPALTSIGSTVRVVWSSFRWTGDGDTAHVGISVDGGETFTDQTVTLADSWQIYTNTFEVSATSAIIRWSTVGASKKRFYIDDIAITTFGDTPAGDDVQEFTVPGTSYEFTGLTPYTVYYARVKGNAGWSDTEEFITEEAPAPGIAPAWSSDFPTTATVTAGEDYELPNVSTNTSGSPSPTVEVTAADSEDWYFANDTFLFNTDDAGTYTFTFTASNVLGTADAILTITVTEVPAPLSDFEQWLSAHEASGHDAGETAPNGRTYWDNYIADIDPGDTYLAIEIADPSAGTFTIPAASPNRTYTFLWTTNLATGDYQQQDLGAGAPSAPIAFPTPGDWYGGLEVALPSDP